MSVMNFLKLKWIEQKTMAKNRNLFFKSLLNALCVTVKTGGDGGRTEVTFSLISVSSVMEFLLWWLKISWIFVQQIFVIYESANLHNMTFLLALVSVLTILIFETLHFQNDFCHL